LPTTERQWKLAEIAAHQGTSICTVRRWTKRRVNRLKTKKFGHRTVRVPDSFYASFLKSQEV